MNNGENNTNNANINTNVNLSNDLTKQNIQTAPSLGSMAGSPVTSNVGQVSVEQGNQNISNPTSMSSEISPVGVSTTNSVNTQTISNSTSTPESVVENLTPSTGDGGPGSVVNEKLKEVEINYTPPSKFKTFMTIVMFLVIIAFVIFLPDITSMVNQYKLNKNKVPETIITTGQLECSLKSNTSNLDMEYLRIFKFTDSQLYEVNYTLTTKGDATLDEKTLDGMAEKCNLLSDHTKDLAGVSISCNYSDGKLVEKQNFIFASINYKNLDAAFTEAGGTYPEFRDGQEIESIEKTMNAAGYSCVRREN